MAEDGGAHHCRHGLDREDAIEEEGVALRHLAACALHVAHACGQESVRMGAGRRAAPARGPDEVELS